MLIQHTLEPIAGILELGVGACHCLFPDVAPILNRRFGELKSVAPLWLQISQKKFLCMRVGSEWEQVIILNSSSSVPLPA
jgi:hypothetical protein